MSRLTKLENHIIFTEHIVAIEKYSNASIVIYLTGGHKIELAGDEAIAIWESWSMESNRMD